MPTKGKHDLSPTPDGLFDGSEKDKVLAPRASPVPDFNKQCDRLPILPKSLMPVTGEFDAAYDRARRGKARAVAQSSTKRLVCSFTNSPARDNSMYRINYGNNLDDSASKTHFDRYGILDLICHGSGGDLTTRGSKLAHS